MKRIIKLFSICLMLMFSVLVFVSCGKEQNTLNFTTKEGSAVNLVTQKGDNNGERSVKYNDEVVGKLVVKSEIKKDDDTKVVLNDEKLTDNSVAFSLVLSKEFIAMPNNSGQYKRIKFCIDEDSQCYYIFYTCQNVENSKITATEDDNNITFNFSYQLDEDAKSYNVYLTMGTDVSVIL